MRERLSRLLDHDKPHPVLVVAGIALIGLILGNIPLLLGYAGIHGVMTAAAASKLAFWFMGLAFGAYVIGGGLRAIGEI
jgi:hypothetical protein